MSSLLLVDEPAPHVRLLTLNRQDELNAMTAELCKALRIGLLADVVADHGDVQQRRARGDRRLPGEAPGRVRGLRMSPGQG